MASNYHEMESKPEEQLKTTLKHWTTDQLIDWLVYIKKNRAFCHKDRLKLQILDDVDFTIWACNSKFEIVLWEGTCTKNYGHAQDEALGSNYLDLIVDPIERAQSKQDCIDILKTGNPQHFRLCDDVDKRGRSIQVITQCCRIKDDDETYLQAEMAIHVDYQRLVRESEEFIKKEIQERKEMESMRKELLDACDECLKRLVDTTEQRMYYFNALRSSSDSTTYQSAFAAMSRLVEIRQEYTNYYRTIKNFIKKIACKYETDDTFMGDHTCDCVPTTTEAATNHHSFDCVYRDDVRRLNQLLQDFQNKGIDYGLELSAVALATSEEES